MPRIRLTKSAIDVLPTPASDVVYWDAGCPGFGVKVTPKGRKVFIVLYRTGGAGSKLRKYTIGPYGRVTLHQARVAAQKVFTAKLDGRDPAAEKREAKRRVVADRVEDLLETYIAKRLSKVGLPTLPMAASRRSAGIISRRSSSRLPASSRDYCDNPVTLPPGRARLAIMPVPTGSLASANTMGITDVTCFVAGTARPDVTITSTLSRTSSAAISAKLSLRPCAQCISIRTVRPSIQPSSFSRCTNVAVHWFQAKGVAVPKNPMVGSFAACCARAASGHAITALPSSVMNSRRFSEPNCIGCP